LVVTYSAALMITACVIVVVNKSMTVLWCCHVVFFTDSTNVPTLGAI